jgi:hypothetical protein
MEKIPGERQFRRENLALSTSYPADRRTAGFAYFQITDYCRKKGITFLCSAFDPLSGLSIVWCPSLQGRLADLTNLPLLEHLVGNASH